MKTAGTIKSKTRGRIIFTTLAAGLLIIAFGLITQPFSAEARGPFGGQKSPDQIMERLTERLDLTDVQILAIRPVIEEKILKMNESRTKAGPDRQTARAGKMRLKWDTTIKLNEILTDEQIAKYLELRQERHGKFRGNKMGKGFKMSPEKVIEHMTERLDLTPEQAEAITPIIEESIEKKQAVFEKYGGVRQTMRNEMQTIGDETETELSTILTNDQMEDLRTFRNNKRAHMDKRMSKNW